jgi:hypothetical protein
MCGPEPMPLPETRLCPAPLQAYRPPPGLERIWRSGRSGPSDAEPGAGRRQARGSQLVDDPNPLLLRVQHAQLEAEQRRIMERALAEASPLEKVAQGPPTTPGDRIRLRGTPIQTKGVGGTMLGTDPLRALLAKERRQRGRRQR